MHKISKRGKNKINADFGIREYYQDYIKKFEDSSVHNIDKHKYKTIIEMMGELLFKELLTSNEVRLPKRLGIISFKKYKQNIKVRNGIMGGNLPPDWKKTLEYWKENPNAERKVLRTLNEHFDGYRVKLVYNKKTANFKNKTAYRIKLVRDLHRQLAKEIKNGKVDFYEL
jgi:hypothetical protein